MSPPISSQSASNTADGENRPVLLCLSHLRWNFVYQRPQHLLKRAAATHDVIFLEEPVFRDVASAELELSRQQGVRVAVPILPRNINEPEIVLAQKQLLDGMLEGVNSRRLVTWYYTPLALLFSEHLRPALCVYDNMDELSAFLGASQQMLSLEGKLFDRADLIFTGGQSLFEAKRGRHRSVHTFPSSIDFDHFAAARTINNEPAAQAGVPHPRLGFFGVIDERMNLDLVREIAEARPDWQLIMVGPIVKIDPLTVPRRSNIHWLGAQSYDDLPKFLASWDLGLMPFAINEATRFISPTKTPEFLAAGLPVISTPIADVIRPYGERALVEIANDAASFVHRIETLLGRPKDQWQQRVDEYLATMSWDKTWSDMAELMRDAERRKVVSSTAGDAAFLEVQGV